MSNSTASIAESTAFASVDPPTGLADELLDQLVAFRPIDVVLIDNQMGASEATLTQVVTIDENGIAHNRGEIPIFWVVVRDQLRKATEATPWVAGVFTKAGRAYRLRELTAAETKRVSKGLTGLTR